MTEDPAVADDEDEDIHDEALAPVMAAIGKVVMAGAMVEESTSVLYAVLLGAERGLLVAVGQSFQQNFDASQALIKQMAETSADWGWGEDLPDDYRPPGVDSLDGALRTAKSLWEERNQVVHSRMTVVGERITFFRPRKWKAQPETTVHTIASLNSLATRLDAHARIMVGAVAFAQMFVEWFDRPEPEEQYDEDAWRDDR